MPPLSEVLEEIISENYKRKISYDGRKEKALWEVLAAKAQQGQERTAEIIKAAEAVNRRQGLPSLAEEAKEAEKAKVMR